MKDRGLFKTIRGEYVPAPWTGKNESGWDPTGAMVLVLPDKAATQSAGGILKPDESVEREAMAAEAGTIVAVGPTAFVWADRERTTKWVGKTPQPGDRVCYQRYSGVQVSGDDAETYSIMNDFCIGATRPGAVPQIHGEHADAVLESVRAEAAAVLGRIGQNGKSARKRAGA